LFPLGYDVAAILAPWLKDVNRDGGTRYAYPSAGTDSASI